MSDDLFDSDPKAIAVHLRYLRSELDTVVQNMATKQDIATLRESLAGYAKAETVGELSRRVDHLEKQSAQNTLGETAKRWANGFLLACAVLAAIGAIAGATAAAVHWFDQTKAK